MNQNDDRPEINWTLPKLTSFKLAYHAAVEQSLDQFTFDGHEFVTSYAKYLIEYLDGQLAR